MNKIIHIAVAYFVAAPAVLRAKRERGVSTLEAVIWIGGIALLAVAAVALLGPIIQGWIAKIPT